MPSLKTVLFAATAALAGFASAAPLVDVGATAPLVDVGAHLDGSTTAHLGVDGVAFVDVDAPSLLGARSALVTRNCECDSIHGVLTYVNLELKDILADVRKCSFLDLGHSSTDSSDPNTRCCC